MSRLAISRTDRGFGLVRHFRYPSDGGESRLIQESSAVGDYEDAYDHPGSSFLWVGDDHHLDREEVTELVAILNTWLKTGTLDGRAE